MDSIISCKSAIAIESKASYTSTTFCLGVKEGRRNTHIELRTCSRIYLDVVSRYGILQCVASP